MTAKEIFENAQWDMIDGVKYLDKNECITLIEKLRVTSDRTAIVKDVVAWIENEWIGADIFDDENDREKCIKSYIESRADL